MSTPDFRALCAQLVDDLEPWVAYFEIEAIGKSHDLIDRARAALAEPEGEGPSDKKLLKTYCEARRAFYFEAAEGESDQEDRKAATIAGLRATLARWGNPAPPAPLADLAAKLISESKPMDPEMAEALTPEARWDLYSGPDTPPAPEPGEVAELVE